MSKIIESIKLSLNQAQDWFVILPWYFQLGVVFSIVIITMNIIIKLIVALKNKNDRR